MKLTPKKNGFSLIEILLAIGTLAIGMTFISGTFLAGIYLSTVSTERTIAAVVADEAFAKIRLYGVDLSNANLPVNSLISFESLNTVIESDEFAYPSTRTQTDKQYYWSALCRPLSSSSDNRLLQVTVFISRKVGSGTTYPGDSDRPVPVRVGVSLVAGSESKLTINNQANRSYINDGYKIVDNRTGKIYRVLQRDFDAPETIILGTSWQDISADYVWVVPPPVNGGRNPGIAIYQKVIRF